MSVSDWFSSFCSNIRITNTDSISKRYKRITKRLNIDFWGNDSEVTHSLYVGSYGRDTAIDTISDLDMAFWLPWSVFTQYDKYNGNGQSALLQAVRASIQATYPTTEMGADGQVLSVTFTDNITFEILPCFEFDNKSLYYPNANGGGSWATTDPRIEIFAIRDRNERIANGNLKRLCRMMRAWKDFCDVPIPGILIDTIAYQFILTSENREKSYLYYDWISRDFFDYMADQARTQEYWKAPGSGRHVYRDGLFESKARRACNLAKEAITYEANGYHASAKSKWREIFGSSFPS